MAFEAWNDVNQFGLYLKNNEITFFKNDNPNPVSIWIIEHDWIFYFSSFPTHHPDGSWFWWILLKLDFISIEITKRPYFVRFSYPSSLFTTFQKNPFTPNLHSKSSFLQRKKQNIETWLTALKYTIGHIFGVVYLTMRLVWYD